MAERRTLNSRILQEGLEIRRYVPNKRLSADLAEFAADYAKGEYSEARIVSADLALKGSEWQPEEQGHIVYIRYKKQLTHRIQLVQIDLVNTQTQERSNTIPLHTL